MSNGKTNSLQGVLTRRKLGFVKEFNIKGMANEAIKVLKMKDEDYYNLVYNEKVDKFIEKHKGWDKIVEEIYSNL